MSHILDYIIVQFTWVGYTHYCTLWQKSTWMVIFWYSLQATWVEFVWEASESIICLNVLLTIAPGHLCCIYIHCNTLYKAPLLLCIELCWSREELRLIRLMVGGDTFPPCTEHTITSSPPFPHPHTSLNSQHPHICLGAEKDHQKKSLLIRFAQLSHFIHFFVEFPEKTTGSGHGLFQISLMHPIHEIYFIYLLKHDASEETD